MLKGWLLLPSPCFPLFCLSLRVCCFPFCSLLTFLSALRWFRGVFVIFPILPDVAVCEIKTWTLSELREHGQMKGTVSVLGLGSY